MHGPDKTKHSDHETSFGKRHRRGCLLSGTRHSALLSLRHTGFFDRGAHRAGVSDEEGAWEWKGAIIRDGQCAYGKFFNRKAGFVSRAWLPDWINYRRARSLAPNDDVAALDDVVMQTIQVEGTATIQELRRMLGFAQGGRSRRRAAIARPHPDPIADGDASGNCRF